MEVHCKLRSRSKTSEEKSTKPTQSLGIAASSHAIRRSDRQVKSRKPMVSISNQKKNGRSSSKGCGTRSDLVEEVIKKYPCHCEVCRKRFPTPSKLKRHQVVHSGKIDQFENMDSTDDDFSPTISDVPITKHNNFNVARGNLNTKDQNQNSVELKKLKKLNATPKVMLEKIELPEAYEKKLTKLQVEENLEIVPKTTSKSKELGDNNNESEANDISLEDIGVRSKDEEKVEALYEKLKPTENVTLTSGRGISEKNKDENDNTNQETSIVKNYVYNSSKYYKNKESIAKVPTHSDKSITTQKPSSPSRKPSDTEGISKGSLRAQITGREDEDQYNERMSHPTDGKDLKKDRRDHETDRSHKDNIRRRHRSRSPVRIHLDRFYELSSVGDCGVTFSGPEPAARRAYSLSRSPVKRAKSLSRSSRDKTRKSLFGILKKSNSKPQVRSRSVCFSKNNEEF